MNPESKVFGVTVRSFCALFIIVATTLVLSYQAASTGEVVNLMLLASNAIGFLFGKSAGTEEAKKTNTP